MHMYCFTQFYLSEQKVIWRMYFRGSLRQSVTYCMWDQMLRNSTSMSHKLTRWQNSKELMNCLKQWCNLKFMALIMFTSFSGVKRLSFESSCPRTGKFMFWFFTQLNKKSRLNFEFIFYKNIKKNNTVFELLSFLGAHTGAKGRKEYCNYNREFVHVSSSLANTIKIVKTG